MNNNPLHSTLNELVYNKRVFILGFGREGRSTYELLKQTGGFSKLYIVDANTAAFTNTPCDGCYTTLEEAGKLNACDIIFKSPGIALDKSGLNCTLTSQTEIFLSVYKDSVIGITGTKGKSTVTSLIYHTLNTACKDTVIAGNIGIPFFDAALAVTPDTIIVAELSCLQLEYCAHSPAIAVLLNIYEDHLDRFGTKEHYIKAKTNIFLNQPDNAVIYAPKSGLPCVLPQNRRVIYTDKSDLPFKSFNDIGEVMLMGEHNLLNAAFAYNVCKNTGISDKLFKEALLSFKPLPHRLEYIGNINGADYYDDSISTTAESTILAAKSVPNIKTLIIGGLDRGIDYTPLTRHILACDMLVICMYGAGKRVYDTLIEQSEQPGQERFIYVNNLSEAAQAALRLTPKGGACVLSPAAASYDAFKNFEERGDFFKSCITKAGYYNDK